MSFNARFRSRKRNGVITHSLQIVKNFRDRKKDMRPNQTLIKYIATINEFNFDVPTNQDKLWQKIETETLRLLKDGTITQADCQKIINKFGEFIPHRVKGSVFKPVLNKIPLPRPRSH
jgi:hypothetical protein